MTAIPPQWFQWTDDGVMRPRLPHLADKHYVVGQSYRLEPREERSHASHAHYFSMVNEVFANLPEKLAEQFPSAEHLRKWALIRTGWHHSRSIVCASEAEARRVAGFIEPLDSFAVVTVTKTLVTVLTAKSQSYREMNKQDFAKSKIAVLDYLAPLIGTTVAEVEKADAA